MRPQIVKQETYLSLLETGIDIQRCEIDFRVLSVTCDDLSRYRKALRVKIRALIKQGDNASLHNCVDTLYALALFAKHLYGFHSCNSEVEHWQEETAKVLQTSFDITKYSLYNGQNWINYDKESYSSSDGIQDGKPFLTLKDKAHFDRLFLN
ncbi:MAG TPA: hypothetical protein ENK66_00580 [Arcobacter sp.]|nr:hypothetical protein [Arcobacter sp.]